MSSGKDGTKPGVKKPDNTGAVKKGDIVARISLRPSMLNVNSAESQLQTSKINLANQAADLERYQKLFAQHLISETDFNQFTMNFNVQKEAVGSAENAGHQRRRPDD